MKLISVSVLSWLLWWNNLEAENFQILNYNLDNYLMNCNSDLPTVDLESKF